MMTLLKSPPTLDFVGAGTPPAQAHVDLADRAIALTQPDGTHTGVTVPLSQWRDDRGSPLRTVAFRGVDAAGVQLSGALLYFEAVPRLHIDRIPPPLRAADYALREYAPDTYSGANADCRPVTVTLLDEATRTVQIAEFDYATVTYTVAAEDWMEESLGDYQSTVYAVEIGALQIHGGFLVGDDSLGWLQTREYPPPTRAGDYNLALIAPDTYSGVNAEGNTATVTLLDEATRTVQIAEQGWPTVTYSVPAADWVVESAGEYQSIVYVIQAGELAIHGGFLTGDASLAWLQTRAGAGRADSYDTTVVWQVLTLAIAPGLPALAVAEATPHLKIARGAPALGIAARRPSVKAVRAPTALHVTAAAPTCQATPATPALAVAESAPAAQIAAITPRVTIDADPTCCC